jgi:hypothetical protein
MSIHISKQTEAHLNGEAERQGVSVDALLQWLISERGANVNADDREAPELPVWHLGPMGSVHRREIYDDVL